jgi:hypothetical protein
MSIRDLTKIARDLCGRGCGCDKDATDGCPNWNGERCTWQEFSIVRALAAERAAGRVEGLAELEGASREFQVIAIDADSRDSLYSQAYRDGLMRAKAIIDARILALRSAAKTGDGTI